jgi:hypothetical protein
MAVVLLVLAAAATGTLRKEGIASIRVNAYVSGA